MRVSGRLATWLSCSILCCGLLGGCSLLFEPATSEAEQEVEGDFYISPDGDDGNPGTSKDEPFKSWSMALAQLRDGKTLVVMDGVYETSTTGLPNIDCSLSGSSCEGGPCENGYDSSSGDGKITIIAEHERLAVLRADPASNKPALRISECTDWSIEGLVIEGVGARCEPSDNECQNPPIAKSTVAILGGSSRIALRRLLVFAGNRLIGDTRLLTIADSNEILVEDTSFYDFSDKGIYVFKSQMVSIRKSYVNGDGPNQGLGRDHIPIALRLEGSEDVAIDNLLAEKVRHGVQIWAIGGSQARNTTITGSLFLDISANGVSCQTQCGSCPGVVCPGCSDSLLCSGTTVTNSVVINSNIAFSMSSPDEAVLDHVMTFNSQEAGLQVLLGDDNNETIAAAATIRDSLLVGSGVGVISTQGVTTVIERVNFFDSVQDKDWSLTGVPSGPVAMTDPELNGCYAYVPASSPLETIFDGVDYVGARILYESVGGVEDRSKPIWGKTGQFPCGASVEAIRLSEIEACETAHERLRVGTEDCPLPY